MVSTSYSRAMIVSLMAMLATSLLVLTLLGPAALPAQAQSAPSGATITVNTSADEDNTDADCSLREAIKAANTNGTVDACPAGSSTAEDTIDFDLGSSPVTITLGSTLPAVTDAAGLTVDGATAEAPVTVSGNDQVRVLYNQAKLNLRDLTITRGRAYTTYPSYNDPAAAGGGIYNAGGTLELSNVTLSANKAMINGGAIAKRGGSLKVTGSTFSGNIADMAFGDEYTGGGGAIEGSSQVTDTTFDNNTGYYGGAIYGYVNVSNSTFTGNGAYRGGGIFGAPKVSNSTFANNESYVGGGGIDSRHTGTAEVSNSTFYRNTFSAPFSIQGYATLRNTILADNGQPSCGMANSPNQQVITDLGGNIEENTNTCGLTEANGSLPNTNPKLLALQNNGGPTKTMALHADSPAIDLVPQGTNGCGTDLTEDQRGETRPKGQGCDAGAFEAEDERAPEAPAIASPDQGTYDNDGTFSVSGTAEKGSTVELFEGEQSLGTDAADASSGQWSIDLEDVSEGTHSYTATATDAAGSTSEESEARTVVVDKSAPALDGMAPVDKATGVSRDAQPTATFSDEMDPDSLSASTAKLYQWNAKKKKWQSVPVAVSVEGKTATLDSYPSEPSRLLGAKKKYKVTVTTGAKNLAGLGLASTKSWTFTTGG